MDVSDPSRDTATMAKRWFIVAWEDNPSCGAKKYTATIRVVATARVHARCDAMSQEAENDGMRRGDLTKEATPMPILYREHYCSSNKTIIVVRQVSNRRS